MEATEIEKFVSDLEIAVDRLRSLYEQYFMGIEKLEPLVPRKDVDRRVQVLRKEQIRNTAQRFRFQMLLQRYNTYQTHWQRICREIENGTYVRHLIKAKRRFGDAAVPGLKKRASTAPPPPPAEVAKAPVAAVAAAPGQPLPADLAAELAELDREFAPTDEIADDDLELVEEGAAAAAKTAVAPKKMAWRKAEPARPRASQPPPAPAPNPVAPGARGPAASPAARQPGPTAASPNAPKPAAAPARSPGPAAVASPPAASPPAARPPAVVARPVQAPPAAAAPRAVPAPAAPQKEDLPDERVRQLYAQYVDTKRKQNESTVAITYESVAKSLRDSSAKLREKHGKRVDFEVTVKDGKTILKPVLK